MAPTRTLVSLFLALGLAASACGSAGEEATPGSVDVTVAPADDELSDGGSTDTIAEESTTDDQPDQGESGPETDESDDAGDESGDTEEDDPDDVEEADGADEGSPLDFGPTAGTPLDVVGVRSDDTLNFRAGPGTQNEILTTVAPRAAVDITATGEAWQFERSIWWKVTVDGQEAWANQRFLAPLGDVIDITDDVLAAISSDRADTIEELANRVAESRADTDPAPSIVVIGEPEALDAVGGRMVIDVLGFPDDSVHGERLVITVSFGREEGSDTVDFVVLERVDALAVCARGLSGGLCV